MLAYYEGYLCSLSGKTKINCPFDDDPRKKFLWDLGFSDAESGIFRDWVDIVEREKANVDIQ